MSATKNIEYSIGRVIRAFFADCLQLVKFRLSMTVVFSALIAYLLAAGTQVDLLMLPLLALAGFCVTASANTINQILEKDYDKLMKRTANRPLATGRMQVPTAVLIAGCLGIIGLLTLAYSFNTFAALLGALSLFSYAFIYTPLKRISPIAVLVGAIPGALPPMIGWVAATGILGFEAFVLFSIQFLWQFPHFWAIGWLGAESYDKAGYKMIPAPDQRNRFTAAQAILYINVLIPVSCIPYFMNLVSMVSVISAILLGAMFLYFGIRLYQRCDDKAALGLMFASIVYLPMLQIIMVIDRLCFVV